MLMVMSIISWVVNLYSLALFVRFIMQWIDKDGTNALNTALKPLTEPIMQPLRKYLVFGEIDFSAIGAGIIISLVIGFLSSILLVPMMMM